MQLINWFTLPLDVRQNMESAFNETAKKFGYRLLEFVPGYRFAPLPGEDSSTSPVMIAFEEDK